MPLGESTLSVRLRKKGINGNMAEFNFYFIDRYKSIKILSVPVNEKYTKTY